MKMRLRTPSKILSQLIVAESWRRNWYMESYRAMDGFRLLQTFAFVPMILVQDKVQRFHYFLVSVSS